MFWHERDPELREQIIREAGQWLILEDSEIVPTGALALVGWVCIAQPIYVRVRVRIEFPQDFHSSGQIPIVYDENKVYAAPDPEGHINPDHSFCLGIERNTEVDTPRFSMEKLAARLWIFLVGEELYQRDKLRERLGGKPAKWPGEAYSHGEEGLKEADRERLTAFCRCGSGKLYRRCCGRRQHL